MVKDEIELVRFELIGGGYLRRKKDESGQRAWEVRWLAEQPGRIRDPAFPNAIAHSRAESIAAFRDLLALLPEDQQVKARSDNREQQDQDHQHNLCCRIAAGIHYVGQGEYVQNDDCESKKRTEHVGSPFIGVVALGYEPAKSKVRQ
jgi:hypothetical protein